MKKSVCLISCFTFNVIVMMAVVAHAELSIHMKDSNVEITGAGGISRMGTASGCVEGSGKEQTDVRDLAAFTEIIIDGVFEVTIDFKKKPSLVIRGDDNILPYISTEVKGQILTIHSNRSICPKRNLVVQISTAHLDRLTADGADDITIVKMNNREFAAALNGSSDLRVSGETGKFSVTIDGTGTVLAENLLTEETEIFIDGSGEAVVHASRKLTAEISGAGDIRYYGNPPDVTKNIDGVGDIEPQ